MKTFHYLCIHFPSGTTHAGSCKFATHAEYLKEVCRWNNQQPGRWAYAPMSED